MKTNVRFEFFTWYQYSWDLIIRTTLSMASSSNDHSATTLTPPPSTLPIVKNISPEISSKLVGTNFLVWKMQVLPVLQCHRLAGLIDGSLPCPDRGKSNPVVVARLRLNQMVLAWIATSLSDEVLPQIVQCTFACEIWMTLDSLYGIVTEN